MNASDTWRIGVDTGGTFTDVVAVDAHQRVRATHKLLSTPDDPAAAVLEGIAAVLAKLGDHAPAAQPHVVHGSTVATNALLEGKASGTALITTAGFEDLLALARQDRPDLYAIAPTRGQPLVPADTTLGAAERVAADGVIVQPLQPQTITDLIERLRELEPESVAISLLHSYAQPAHEQQIAHALRQAFGDAIHLTVSHELLPEYREYERTATCAVNAVVAPRMVRYLGRLSEAIGEQRLRIMGSHGGTLPVAATRAAPVRTVLSGPAGGALGAAAMANAAGVRGVITLDMGGTSTDVALCLGREPKLTHDGEAGGVPVRLQMVDMHTVGAGGGSLASVDPAGALRVGPESAGANPGPACYGRQHRQNQAARSSEAGRDARAPRTLAATVTDAHVILGHIPANARLGGSMKLDRDAARHAVAHIAEQAGLSLEQAAEGILRVAEATMARAIARISLQRGHDPRPLALVPFGGAGGLHACRLAQTIGMRRVLVPRHAGLLSAVGMLGASPRHTFSQTLLLTIPPADRHTVNITQLPQLRDAFHQLKTEADAAIAAENLDPTDREDLRSLDLRYAGQSYELTIPLDGLDDDDPAAAQILERFATEHERLYGYRADDRPIEIVTVRWQTGGRTAPVDPGPLATDQPTAENEAATVHVYEADQNAWRPWRYVTRDALRPGQAVEPRTIITEYSATTVVPPDWAGHVDEQGQIVLERVAEGEDQHASADTSSETASAGRAGAVSASTTRGFTDGVELEVFKHLFASAAEEMGVRLMRSAYSANIKERRDFSCALFDSRGEMIAQAAHIPVHLGSAPLSVQAIIAAFDPAAMQPHERFIVNDPYAGGTHLPDITVVAPVFVADEQRPRFFVASRAHHADVGGTTPGSLPISTSIDDEGVRIPPSRLDEALVETIARQTRTPDERRGDLRAQLASLQVGIDRLHGLCHRHGPDRITQMGDALQAYTARFVRELIRTMPDGRYTFTDVLDDDGHGQTDIAIRCTLTVDGDRARVDLRQSDDQVTGPVNAVRAIALSAVLYVFRCLAPAQIPSNSGVLRGVEVLTRPGSIVDARYPAAVAGGNVETSQRIVDVLMGALAQVLPDRVPAASCGSMNNLTIGSINPDDSETPATAAAFTYYETLAGGAGAAPTSHGGSAIQTHMTNTRNTPVEALEHAFPFRIDQYAIRRGSGGAGRFHGGDGVTRRYHFLSPAQVTLLTERRTHQPWGLAGGNPAASGVNQLIRKNTDPQTLPAKQTFNVQPGDSLQIQTPGGGGWNRPGRSCT